MIETLVAKTFFAVFDAVLDREIGPETDEQHHERNRDHVERADHQEPERGRHRQANRKRHEDRTDHPLRAQRQPENSQHDNERANPVDRGAVRDGCELFVGKRLLACQAHHSAVTFLQFELFGGGANSGRGLCTGTQCRVVDHRLDRYECAGGLTGCIRIDERAPRKSSGFAGQYRVDGVGTAREQRCHTRQAHLP